jgi:ceramide synthetase
MDVPLLSRDAEVFGVFTVALFCFNWGWRCLVVEPILKCNAPMKRSTLMKFEQSVMEAIFYGAFAVLGVAVVRGQVWVWPSSNWWHGFSDGGHEVMRSDLRCYYILYVARYFQAGVSVMLETKRKDFVEMMLHHIVTVCVGYVSYLYGWNRVGAVVMLLLDFADVPLHMAKCCKYMTEVKGTSRKRRAFWQFAADRLFELFALTFFITRLVMYGYVCWSAHVEASRYWPKGLPEWTCVACLHTLLGLQVYWFLLILKVVAKLFRGQGAEDPRSSDEEKENAQPVADPAAVACSSNGRYQRNASCRSPQNAHAQTARVRK